MALTFPRAMPAVGANNCRFEIARADFMSAELGGQVGSVAAAFPRWSLEVELGEMDRGDADAWRAFLRSLRGSGRLFYGRNLNRDFPKAYPTGFAGLVRAGTATPLPADGAPTSWSVNGTRDVLTLNGMSAGFLVGEGDEVGFVWSGTRRTIAASVEAVVADGAGQAVFTVEPPLPSIVPGGATISLRKPDVVMRVATDGTEVGPEDPVSTAGGRIVAVQVLLA